MEKSNWSMKTFEQNYESGEQSFTRHTHTFCIFVSSYQIKHLIQIMGLKYGDSLTHFKNQLIKFFEVQKDF